MSICFLIGSGVSRETLGVGVEEIHSALYKEHWCKNANRYIEVDDEEDSEVGSFQKYLTKLEDYIHEDLTAFKKDEINYEHLYHICNQFANYSEREKIDFLIIKEFKELSKQTNHYWKDDFGGFATFNREVCRYIESVVFNKLTYNGDKFDYLNIFSELKENSQKAHIFTLNHDLLLERYFRRKEISFNDCFKENGELRKFSQQLVGNIEDVDFCVYKLHGSINWGRSTGDFYGYYCINETGDELFEEFPYRFKGVDLLKHTPEIITGHSGKARNYFQGIYSFLMGKFVEVLNENDVLVVSGFGWKDYTIRGIVNEWLTSSSSKQLILCYADDEAPRSFFMRKQKRIKYFDFWLDELKYEHLEGYI